MVLFQIPWESLMAVTHHRCPKQFRKYSESGGNFFSTSNFHQQTLYQQFLHQQFLYQQFLHQQILYQKFLYQ